MKTKIFFAFNIQFFLALGVLTTSLFGQSSNKSTKKKGWKLVWSDEFDGESLDSTKWHVVDGKKSKSEQTWYTARKKNVRLEDGKLILESHYEKDLKQGDIEVSSGRVQTASEKGKLASFKYGRIEASIRFPKISGVHASFRTMGTSYFKKSFPRCGEIDVIDYLPKSPRSIWNSVKYLGDNKKNTQIDNKGFNPLRRDMSRRHKFYTYAVEWNETELTFFCNGQISTIVDIKDLDSYGKNPFRKSHFLILSQALGGWGGQYKAEKLPVKMEVDWVRVYSETVAAKIRRKENAKKLTVRKKWRQPREKHIKDQAVEIDL